MKYNLYIIEKINFVKEAYMINNLYIFKIS